MGHSSFASKWGQAWGRRARWRLAVAEPLCSLKSRARRKLPEGNFRRPLVGSLRACSSAEMAALKCIAAARSGFLLAALHSVAERFSHRQAPAPPPSPHPDPLASKRGCTHSRLLREEKSRETRWGWLEPQGPSLAVFPPSGHMPRLLSSGNGAAGSGGGGVRCSLRARAWRAASERRPARSSSLVVPSCTMRVSAPPTERCRLQRASRAASERGRFRASAQESSKRASPKRARRLQRTTPPPLPRRPVPVC